MVRLKASVSLKLEGIPIPQSSGWKFFCCDGDCGLWILGGRARHHREQEQNGEAKPLIHKLPSYWRMTHRRASIQLQPTQIFAKGPAQIFPLERKLDCGFQKAELIAGIMAAAFIDVGVHLFLLEQTAQSVR